MTNTKEEIGQLTEKQAYSIAESGIWKNWSDEEVVKFQLFQKRLCMDFSRFHSAMEKVLGRSIWTHEFAFWELLVKEYLKERKAPTFEEIMNLIPKDKQIMVIEGSSIPILNTKLTYSFYCEDCLSEGKKRWDREPNFSRKPYYHRSYVNCSKCGKRIEGNTLFWVFYDDAYCDLEEL